MLKKVVLHENEFLNIYDLIEKTHLIEKTFLMCYKI